MANDFSGDANCVALWKLENSVNDSKGSNNLTAVNSPAYDSSDKKEGSYCFDLESGSSQYAYRNDADLDSGFPGKSGTGEQSFSICFWTKPESLTAWMRIINKFANDGTKSWGIYLYSDYKVRFLIGYNSGNSSTGLSFGTALTAGRWYHIAVVYDAATNGMKIRIWDDYNQQLLGSNATGTAGGDMSPTSQPLQIGRDNASTTYYYDGKIDEIAFFKDVLTDDEIDQIRAGTYGASATEKSSSDTGTGTDSVESLQTPQAKSSSDAGSGVEGTPLQSAIIATSEGGSGLEALIARLLSDDENGNGSEISSLNTEELKELFASELAEGTDRLVAKIEMPVKGGGMKLWT